jgi:hypothetical protein
VALDVHCFPELCSAHDAANSEASCSACSGRALTQSYVCLRREQTDTWFVVARKCLWLSFVLAKWEYKIDNFVNVFTFYQYSRKEMHAVICVTAYCIGWFVLLRIAWGDLYYCVLHAVICVTAYCMGWFVLLRIAWGDLYYCVLHGVICITAYCTRWFVLLRIACGDLCYCVLRGVISVTLEFMGWFV